MAKEDKSIRTKYKSLVPRMKAVFPRTRKFSKLVDDTLEGARYNMACTPQIRIVTAGPLTFIKIKDVKSDRWNKNGQQNVDKTLCKNKIVFTSHTKKVCLEFGLRNMNKQ